MKVFISDFNDTIKNIEANHLNLVENMRIVSSKVSDNSKDINYLQLKTNLEEYVLLFNIFFEEFEIETMTLTNATLYAQKGILHPSIITPSKLIEELNLINKYYSTNFNFPIPLQVNFSHYLLKTL